MVFVDIFWWVLELHWLPLLENCNGALPFHLIDRHHTLGLDTYLALLDLVFLWHAVPWLLKMTIGRDITAMLYYSWNCLLELATRWRGSRSTIPVYRHWLLSVILYGATWWFNLTYVRLVLIALIACVVRILQSCCTSLLHNFLRYFSRQALLVNVFRGLRVVIANLVCTGLLCCMRVMFRLPTAGKSNALSHQIHLIWIWRVNFCSCWLPFRWSEISLRKCTWGSLLRGCEWVFE